MKILVLNSGSSSQKSAFFELGSDVSAESVPPLWEGRLEWDGNTETLSIRNPHGKKIKKQEEVPPDKRHGSVAAMLQNLWSGPTAVLRAGDDVEAIGHRIVHGGPKLTEP